MDDAALIGFGTAQVRSSEVRASVSSTGGRARALPSQWSRFPAVMPRGIQPLDPRRP